MDTELLEEYTHYQLEYVQSHMDETKSISDILNDSYTSYMKEYSSNIHLVDEMKHFKAEREKSVNLQFVKKPNSYAV